MKERADNIFSSLLDDVHDAVSALEEYIEQGRAQFAESAEEVDAFVTDYEKKSDNIGNEFDIDDNDDEEEAKPADPCENSEEKSTVFSDLQSLDDGVDDADAEENYKEMGLDGKETIRFFGETED